MTLRVRLLSAQLSHDTELLSNMDPYCYLQLGSQRYRSKTKKDAGKKPVWNQEFQFNSSDNQLKITVMDEDMVNDDLVGEGTVNVTYYRNNPNEQQEVVQLYYKGKTAGKVFLSFSKPSGQNVWGNSNTNVWGQNGKSNYNQPGYNQPGYNQPSYNQPSYNQNQSGYNQPNYNQGHYQPNQFGNSSNWSSQGNMLPNNSPWGNLNQNNGWGNFNPSNPNGGGSFSNPNIPPNNQAINPMSVIGGIFGNQNGQNPPMQPGYGNPYGGNPYQ